MIRARKTISINLGKETDLIDLEVHRALPAWRMSACLDTKAHLALGSEEKHQLLFSLSLTLVNV